MGRDWLTAARRRRRLALPPRILGLSLPEKGSGDTIQSRLDALIALDRVREAASQTRVSTPNTRGKSRVR